MPVEHDDRVRSFGTKIRLFPQSPGLNGFADPETVWLSPRAGAVAAGPSDDRFRLCDAADKQQPYAYPYLPPYRGPINEPVQPGPGGHFDHLAVGSREFVVAHAYGCLRRVLDIFESYLGRSVPWQFSGQFERLEIIPLMNWDNAQSGFGYMEFGVSQDDSGTNLPFALNFDIIAHELGHTLLFAVLNLPSDGAWTRDFRAYHESSADLVALLSAMHFDSVLDRLLRSTQGNIYALNEINRIAEISDTRQVRIASNSRKMSEVSDEVHDLSRPMTGAIFDTLVYVFVSRLRELDLIGPDLLKSVMSSTLRQKRTDEIQAAFSKAYRNRHVQFKSALTFARDAIGERLCASWSRLSPDNFRYSDGAKAFLASAPKRGADPYRQEFEGIFKWREISF